jgi:hypothetical protein
MKPCKGRDKQLQSVALKAVLEKRRLEQALNAKEFAICAGVSYSTARAWFHLPGFPVFHGVVFWQDFVRWRTNQGEFSSSLTPGGGRDTMLASLPSRAAQILLEAH